MDPWIGDIEQETLGNDTFRTVVFTGRHTQLTVMSIEPGDDIGGEVHDGHDQFIRIESGSALELGGSEGNPAKARRRRRLGGDHPLGDMAQRRQHRYGAPQGLLALLAARASRRDRPPDEGGCRGCRALNSLARLRRAGLGEAPATSLEVERDVRREAVALDVLHDGRSMPSGARRCASRSSTNTHGSCVTCA